MPPDDTPSQQEERAKEKVIDVVAFTVPSTETTAVATLPPAPTPEPTLAPADPKKKTRKPLGTGKPYVPHSAAYNGPRELPHSIEAEENLLSVCLVIGNEPIARCVKEMLAPKVFFTPANQIIYAKMLELYKRNIEVDTSVVAEELRANGQLDTIGGFAYLAQVSSRVATQAQLIYFINRVKELASVRELIVLTTTVNQRLFEYDGDLDGIIGRFDTGLASIRESNPVLEVVRSITDFDLPPEDDANSLLGRNRYICRGDGVLIVSSAGMGKSSMSLEWATLAALGRPFVGIETKAPLTSLIVQAEDSDGDVGEVWFSIRTAMELTDAQVEIVRQRVIIVRDKVNRGEAFIAKLRMLIEKIKPDLVWLNPLHAYAGCDIADATEMSRFLREGLNKLNAHDLFAYMVVHHTPKPMTGKGVQDKKWHEFMYDAAGSAELINWARAVLTLKPTETEGEFNLILAKRGKRAGVLQEVKSEANTFLEITTKIPLKHSTQQMKIQGRKHPFYLIKWLPRDPDAPKPEGEKSKGGRVSKFSREEVVNCYPLGYANRKSLAQIAKISRDELGMTGKSTFMYYRHELITDGTVKKENGEYYRPTPEDLKAGK